MKSVKSAMVLVLGLAASGYAAAQTQAIEHVPLVQALPEDQQATKEQIAKLFEVMRIRQQMAIMQKMMPQMIAQQIREQEQAALAKITNGNKLTPEQQKKMEEHEKQFVERAFALASADVMIADMTSVYQRHISRDDADALIAFYSTPPAQRLLDVQPVISQELLPLVMSHMRERTQTLTDEMTKDMQDLLKTETPAKN